MRLVVQIPCLNEAETLPETLADIPRTIPGVDEVLVIVVDDGSTDGTAEVAKAHGADLVVRHTHNKGLAAAFQTGLDHALRLGADIVVNTDADGQYPGRYIPDLVAPILRGEADMVIGDRQVHQVHHFSPLKKGLQKLGSAVVRWLSKTDVPDAPSGFRALSREAALRLHVVSRYTYTLETIVRASQLDLAIASVPIQTNPPKRPSRLFRSMAGYVWRSLLTLLRLFVLFEPFKFFAAWAAAFVAAGSAIGLRFVYYYLQGHGSGKIQSLILAAILIIVGFNVFLIGILSANLATNRKLSEELLYRVRKLETLPERQTSVSTRAGSGK